jgi:hypothetical protein
LVEAAPSTQLSGPSGARSLTAYFPISLDYNPARLCWRQFIPALTPVANLHPLEDPVTDGEDELGLRVDAMNSSAIADRLMDVESVTARIVFLRRLMETKVMDIVIPALETVSLAELEIIADAPMLKVP